MITHIRKFASLILFSSALLGFLAACGGGGGDNSFDNIVPVTATSTPPVDQALDATLVKIRVKERKVVSSEVSGELQGYKPITVEYRIRVDAEVRQATWDFGDGTPTIVTGDDEPVVHTYDRPGTYGGTVTLQTDDVDIGAVDPFDGIIVVELPTVEKWQDVNLVVSSFAMDQTEIPEVREIQAGASATVSAIVQNIGSDPLEDAVVYVGYYLSKDDIITVDDILIGDTTIFVGTGFSQGEIAFGAEKLGPGENFQYVHQVAVIANTPLGKEYYLGAIVDYIDEYSWYGFPRATDTEEYIHRPHVGISESDETDNVRLLAERVTVDVGDACRSDRYEPDDRPGNATEISLGEYQTHNFCYDNSDWVKFDAVAGNYYKITTSDLGAAADTQLILYDRDASTILLFHDNICPGACGASTVDLESGWPAIPESQIVWEAEFSGTYFIKVRVTTCDEDNDLYCLRFRISAGGRCQYRIQDFVALIFGDSLPSELWGQSTYLPFTRDSLSEVIAKAQVLQIVTPARYSRFHEISVIPDSAAGIMGTVYLSTGWSCRSSQETALAMQ